MIRIINESNDNRKELQNGLIRIVKEIISWGDKKNCYVKKQKIASDEYYIDVLTNSYGQDTSRELLFDLRLVRKDQGFVYYVVSENRTNSESKNRKQNYFETESQTVNHIKKYILNMLEI